MKKKILDIIYSEFTHWSSKENFFCTKGCAVCCTQNVTITALEGMEIIRFCRENGRDSWLASKLSSPTGLNLPAQTTNEYIASCLEGKEEEQKTADTTTRCPFLENDICTIYPVRPFSCRCFVSKKQCEKHGSALVPDYFLSASMAVMQIIEHLGQFEYWGNINDVLLSLCDRSSCSNIVAALDDPTQIIVARMRTLKALPIPGFILPERDMNKISSLLDAILQKKIGEKTIEHILNGH